MEQAEKMYANLRELLEDRDCETPHALGRELYEDHECGPWTTFVLREQGGVYYDDPEASQSEQDQEWWDYCKGLEIGYIVEGSEGAVGGKFLGFPFTDDDLQQTLAAVEQDSDELFAEATTTVYTVRKADGTVVWHCTWAEFAQEPEGDFDPEDAEALSLATLAGNTLFADSSLEHGKTYPIPGSDLFVQLEVPEFD